MTFALYILRSAQKELAKLPTQYYERVRDAIRTLAKEPRPSYCRKLSGRPGWRIRVGNYRVIYEIDEKKGTVIILHIGHRRDVYR